MVASLLVACSGAAAAADDTPPAAPPASAVTPPAAAPAAPEARIPFANRHGIYDWRVVDRSTVLIESSAHRWYLAKLFAPCFDLPFAQAVGFKSNPDGSFDKFSALEVRGQRCPLLSLVETAAPAKPGKKKVTDPSRGAGDRVS